VLCPTFSSYAQLKQVVLTAAKVFDPLTTERVSSGLLHADQTDGII
jgi:hypothetical protein